MRITIQTQERRFMRTGHDSEWFLAGDGDSLDHIIIQVVSEHSWFEIVRLAINELVKYMAVRLPTKR